MAECSSGSKTFSKWKAFTRRPDVVEASGWTVRVVDILGELISSLIMCHHPWAGQNLTTTICYVICVRSIS